MKILPLFGLIIVTASCNLPNVNKQLKSILAADSVKKAKDAIHHWTYDSSEDKITSYKTYIACLTANQKLSFNQGRAEAGIELIYNEETHMNIFWLDVSRGDFLSPANFRVRFDTAKAENWKFYFPEKGESGHVGIQLSPGNRFIEKLKKTKKLLIEAEFYKEGTYILEFNTEGLKWNYKGKEGEYVPAKPKAANSAAGSRSNQSNSKANDDIFEQFFNPSQNHTKTTVNTTIISGSGSNTTSHATINGYVIDTKDVIDRVNNTVTIKCLYTNKESQPKSVTIKAGFMDAEGNVLSEKSINITCSANDAVSANISASGIADKYKAYRVDIE